MNPDNKSAMDEFLGDIPVADGEERTGDVFNQPLGETEKKPESEEDSTAVVTNRDNREARRAKKALQSEREANIALNERVRVLSELGRFSKETDQDVDGSLITLYGDDENGRKAAQITQSLLNKTKEEAREEALNMFREEQQREAEEVGTHQQELDDMLEDIEDEFNVDLTSNTPMTNKMRQDFYILLEKMSPKNRNGEVTDYADPIATWEMLQLQKKPDNSRAKDLSTRSMVKSSAMTDTNLEDKTQERFLREAGII